MDFASARETMVDSQIRPNDVTDPRLVSAFLRTPRELFVPEARRAVAYSELEIETSPGRALWTPRDTAKLMKLAAAQPADRALVIGAGAGYEAALLAHLASEVFALDETPDLAEAAASRLGTAGLARAHGKTGALAAGLPGEAPFDVIYVCGMVESVPDAWTAQLADGGRLVAVVAGPGKLGRGTVFLRSGGTVAAREAFDACPPRFAAFDAKAGFVF